MKLLWLGYLVYSLSNCVMKLCIETDLRTTLKLVIASKHQINGKLEGYTITFMDMTKNLFRQINFLPCE
jgi:hypothetical protein